MIPGSVIGPRNVPSFHKFADEGLGGLKKKMCDKKLAKLANPNFRNLANLASHLPKSVSLKRPLPVRHWYDIMPARAWPYGKKWEFFFFSFFLPGTV